LVRHAWLSVAERWAMPAILLVAFVLRVYRLGDQNIWWDEGLAIWAVRKSMLGATLWTAQDVHPPLYFWTLWAWVRLAGESEFVVRFISVAWAMLTVAAAYPLGVRLGGRRVGLLGALFLAVARFHVWWSQEMRMYVLATLTATVTLYAAVRWWDEVRHRPATVWLLGYVLGAAGSLYTIYMAALAPVVANCYALPALARLAAPRRRPALVHWLVAQAAALLLFVPWLLLALPRMRHWSVAQPFSFRLFLRLYATLLALGISTEITRYALLLVPFGAILAGGLATLLWARRRPEPGLPGAHAALLLLLTLTLLPLLVYALTRPHSPFYTPRIEARYLVLFAPAFYLFLAWSVVRLGCRSRAVGLAALMSCLGLMAASLPAYYAGRYLRDELQTMSRILGAYVRPGDVVLLISGNRYPLFGYYYERLVPAERRIPIVELPQGERFTADNVAAQLEAATGGRDRFWVAAVEAGIQDPHDLSLPWLDQHFSRVLTHQVGYNALILYGHGATPLQVERDGLSPGRRLDVRGVELELLGYDLPVREYRTGDMVDLGVYLVAREPVRAEVQWRRDDGEVLQTVRQEWPATEQAAARAAIRFKVWPWYRGGPTHFLLSWPSRGRGSTQTVRLAGPRILAAADRPRVERIAQPLEVTFAGGIRLRGYDLHRPVLDGRAEVRAGEELTLDLVWEADCPVAKDYTVFTQLVGSAHNPRAGGPLWGQHDGPPVGGDYATSAWVPGQLIADRHVLTVDAEAPAGEYELAVGLYLPATMERLRVPKPDGGDGADRVVLAAVRVRR